MLFRRERQIRALKQRADEMAVKLQRHVATIRREFPAVASDIDDAGKLLGQLAAELPTGGE